MYKSKKLTYKGTKYRESKAVGFTSAKKNIPEGIDKCIRSSSNKKGLLEAFITNITENKSFWVHWRKNSKTTD